MKIMKKQDNNSRHILTLNIPCSAEYLSFIRKISESVCSDLKMKSRDVEDIKVSITEVCSNSVKYSRGMQELRIDFSQKKGRLLIYVKEQCKSVDMPEESVKCDSAGLGIYIIKKIMDDVKYELDTDYGTSVYMAKKIR
jgi:serine/threonine-protein kinase RsbW